MDPLGVGSLGLSTRSLAALDLRSLGTSAAGGVVPAIAADPEVHLVPDNLDGVVTVGTTTGSVPNIGSANNTHINAGGWSNPEYEGEIGTSGYHRVYFGGPFDRHEIDGGVTQQNAKEITMGGIVAPNALTSYRPFLVAGTGGSDRCGIYLVWDSGNFTWHDEDGGVDNVVDSGVAVDTSYQSVLARYDRNGTGKVEAWLNGTKVIDVAVTRDLQVWNQYKVGWNFANHYATRICRAYSWGRALTDDEIAAQIAAMQIITDAVNGA